jgi:hypothetical protein
MGVSPRSPAGVCALVEGLNTWSNGACLAFVSAELGDISAGIGDPRRGRHRVDPGHSGRPVVFSGA